MKGLLAFLLLLTTAAWAAPRTEVIPLQYRTADDLLPTLQAVLGSEGKVNVYGNQLIVNAERPSWPNSRVCSPSWTPSAAPAHHPGHPRRQLGRQSGLFGKRRRACAPGAHHRRQHRTRRRMAPSASRSPRAIPPSSASVKTSGDHLPDLALWSELRPDRLSPPRTGLSGHRPPERQSGAPGHQQRR